MDTAICCTICKTENHVKAVRCINCNYDMTLDIPRTTRIIVPRHISLVMLGCLSCIMASAELFF